MTDSREEHVGESSTSQNRSKRKRQSQRHTEKQIQQLEAFFKKCAHPDEHQRNQLSREVGLDPNQVRFWFQNRRTQTKTQNEKSDNNTLRTENERLQCENMAMKDAMKNVICPQCDGSSIGKEERARNLERMKMENHRLREEHERISNIIASVQGRSSGMGSNLAPPKSTLGFPSNSSDESLLSQNTCGSPIGYHPPFHQENNHNNNVQEHLINSNNIPIMSRSPPENYVFHHDNRENSSYFGIVAAAAMNEMVQLLQVNEPIWIKSSSDERYFIHHESYDIMFPNLNRPYKSSTARIESSKDCDVVSMNATELIRNFLDPIKWMNMFPTIVTKARTIEVLNSGQLGGSIQLMYEKLHILSPLVEARDFFFMRYCRQLDQATWVMVDVSYDYFKEIQSGLLTCAWKFPSGCVIQDIGNGKSMVSWIEHVQVDEKNQINSIFGDLLCGHQTYGAKRWIVTLQRMSERSNFAMGATCPTRHDLHGVVNDPEGLKNVMQISQRMVKSFCEFLSMKGKLVSPTSSQMNSGDRVSIRKNEEITQGKGFIATASTSVWLPLSFLTVFSFFKDDKTRSLWDVLTGENNVTELVRVLTGTFPGNDITIIQSCMPKENMLILQESSIDEMGAFLIYAPIDLPTFTSLVNGDDAKKDAILPSGIIISHDDRPTSNRGNIGNAQNGSILTVAFQIFIYANNKSIPLQQETEAVTFVHNRLSTTVLKIKAALGCSD